MGKIITVAQWLVLLPHFSKVTGLIPEPDRASLCGVCMFSQCLRRFPPLSPSTQNMNSRIY